MSKDVIINGTTYSGVSEVDIPTANGTAKFRDTDSLPAWIDSMCVQTFTPEVDTNEAKTFALTGLSSVPQVIIVGTTQKTPTDTRDFGGGVYVNRLFGIVPSSSYDKWYGINFYKQTSDGYVETSTSTLISDVSETSMTIQTPSWSSTATYWRAGQTYTIIALVLKDIS